MCFVSHQSTTLSGHALVATDPSIHQHHHHQHRTAAMHVERTRQASRGKGGGREWHTRQAPSHNKMPSNVNPPCEMADCSFKRALLQRAASYIISSDGKVTAAHPQYPTSPCSRCSAARLHRVLCCVALASLYGCMTSNLHSEAAAVTSSTIHAHRDKTDTDQKARSHTGGEGGMRGAGTYGLLMESCTGGCTCHRRQSESLPQHARAGVRSCGSKKVEKKTIKNPR